jgi:hypothetical protein
MQEAEGANAVKAARGDVLEEAAEKLVGVETHDLDRVVGAASISEGDAVIVEREDRFVGEGGAVDVATEVLEDVVGAVDGGLGEDDPRLSEDRFGEHDAGEGATCQAREDGAKEERERLHRNEEAGTGRADPRAAIGGETTAGHQHVNVRMPFERARPGV